MKPDRLDEFNNIKHNLLARTTPKSARMEDLRTAGLLKREFQGTHLLAFSTKLHCVYSDDKNIAKSER